MPSYFTWPFLFLSVDGDHPLITYPLMQQQEEGDTPIPPERLLQLLKATGDATRMQILQLLATEPRSTRQLAGLIRISEATVSKHLKQLQEANLITSKRDSHYVFYQLEKSALAELTDGLSRMFQLDLPMSE
jgi:DNA-binding transcriptional ArsR family regulator